MKKRNITILRWIAVLPGGILFVLLCMFPIHWFVLLRKFDNPAKIEYLSYAFCNPFLLIIATAFIAPSKKFWVGLVFTALNLLLVLWTMIYSKQKDLVTYSTPELTFLVGIISCALGLWYVYNKYWLAGDKENE